MSSALGARSGALPAGGAALPRAAFRARPLLQQILLALVAAVLLGLVIAEGADTRFVPTAVATAFTGTLSLYALVVRRELLPRWALFAAGASGVLSVVSANLAHRPEHTSGCVELCALLALVARTVRHVRPLRATGLFVVLAFAVGLEPLRLAKIDSEQLSIAESVLVLCLFSAVLAGLCLWLYDRLRARERRSIREAQRLEYARELHDFVAHHVTAIVAQTRAVRFATAQGREQDPADLDRMLEGIENAASQSLSSMRGMVSVLRGTADAPAGATAGSYDGGLPDVASVLERAVGELAAAAPPSVQVEVDPELTGRRLPPALVDVAYSVVREGLTNARRHARGATRVTVAAGPGTQAPYGLELSVADDGETGSGGGSGSGVGIGLGDAGSKAAPGGFGLTGLAERIEGAGGRLGAGPCEGGGWRLTAELPPPRAAELRSSRRAL
ncbi:sensor histidine kinase [Streptomyces nanshensis]|uniref:sensor histidine kinase n=1 Tax=Streptomyces nanshensis TaxID=518642 RepID=UPI0009A05EEC|nr:histidine kinase [Streptomyces nanshensis]